MKATPSQLFRWQTGGLRRKLAFGVTALALSLTGAIGIWLLQAESERLVQSAITSAASRLESVALPCAMSLAMDDIEKLDGVLGELVGGYRDRGTDEYDPLRHFELVDMLDHEGIRYAHSGTGSIEPGSGRWSESPMRDREVALAATASDKPRWWRYTGADSRPLLVVAMPAVAGLRWGTLIARTDFSEVERRLGNIRSLMLSGMAVIGLLLFTLVFIAVQFTVIRPIEKLSRAAASMSGGQLDTRVSIQSRDEFGHLAATFNSMADQLGDYTRSLEYKVTMRTKALEEVNQQLASAVEGLERLARTDELTGLLNRRALDESIDFEVRRSSRTSSPMALLIMDLDHFKSVNDRFGHPVGDQVLREVALLFRERLRVTDIIARLGGEEFAVLLLDSGEKAARKVAQSLVETIRQHTFQNNEGLSLGRITTSIGYALFPEQAEDAAELMARADLALYRAKESGRDRAVAWSHELEEAAHADGASNSEAPNEGDKEA